MATEFIVCCHRSLYYPGR